MAQSKEASIPAQTESDLYFGPFRLEQAKRLWRGENLVEVRPRPLAVLRYLAERPSQLVTGDELIKRLWPGIYVTRTVLRVCVRELRQALNENPVAPQFIETMIRQGYRFIAPLTTASPVSGSRFQVASVQPEEESRQLETLNLKLETPFVGRDQELARLHVAFARVQRGERQVVFLMGELGIGKTTVMNRFLAQVRASGQVRIGRGQCIKHYGPGEAYLPLLEAVGQICEGPNGEQVIAVLRRYAPLWLEQFPGLVGAKEQEAIHWHVQGNSQERMLRELAEALEVLAADSMLVLILEDLQWSDTATLEAVAYLAQRQRPVQLYIMGTYRPAEVMVRENPLRRIVQELAGRRQCEELALELFTEAEVEEYLRQRFGRSATLTEFSKLIYRRTDGNALFVVSFVDSLLQQGLLVEADGQVQAQADRVTLKRLVPRSLQQAILRQIERLAVDEQQLLKVASVGGMTFTAAEVAGVLERVLEEVEEKYDDLATQEGVLTVAGIAEGPDGAVTAQYEFRHVLYQQVVYEQLGQGRRVRLHRQLGEWQEARYGERATEIASALAVHFTEGREYRKAAQYHCQAAETVLRRSAYRETMTHCMTGLDLLGRLPDTPERQRQELALRMLLSVALTATQGYAAEELVQNLIRARELCQALNDDATLVSVLVSLDRAYRVRTDREAKEQLTDEMYRLLERVQEPALTIQLHSYLCWDRLWSGALVQGQEHHDRVLALYNPQLHRDFVLQFGMDPEVMISIASGWIQWLAGCPDQARARSKQSLSRARELAHSFSLAYALVNMAWVQLWCGNLDEAERLVEEGVSLAHEHDIAWFIRAGGMLHTYIRAQRGESEVSLALLTEEVSQYRSTGVPLMLPLHSHL